MLTTYNQQILLHPHHDPHFTQEETEAPRDEMICPKPRSLQEAPASGISVSPSGVVPHLGGGASSGSLLRLLRDFFITRKVSLLNL